MKGGMGWLLATAIVGIGLSLNLAARGGEGAPQVRIGVYQSRAVALAYFRSETGSKEIEALYKEAKAAQEGPDKQKAAEWKEKMQAIQGRRHAQVFADSPVDDVMEKMKDALPEVAKKANVAAIVPAVSYKEQGVTTVDVTDLLVEACQPTEQTRKMAADLVKHPPAAVKVVGEE